MKKLKAALAALAAAICLAVPAFADIVVEPEPTAGRTCCSFSAWPWSPSWPPYSSRPS